MLRAPSPLALFLQSLTDAVTYIRVMLIQSKIIPSILSEPLFMIPIAFVAVGGVVGIIGKVLSRD